METQLTATVSARWTPPVQSPGGAHWTATLTDPFTLPLREKLAGLELAVYGPDADACAREAARQDRLWARFPLRRDTRQDRAEAARRERFLTPETP